MSFPISERIVVCASCVIAKCGSSTPYAALYGSTTFTYSTNLDMDRDAVASDRRLIGHRHRLLLEAERVANFVHERDEQPKAGSSTVEAAKPFDDHGVLSRRRPRRGWRECPCG